MPTTQGYDPGFVGAAYEAPNYLQDTQRCINWYPEISPDPHAKEVIGLMGAPGTSDLVTLLANKPVRQAWVLPGGTKTLAVAGANVYLVTQNALAVLSAVQVGTLLTPIGPVQIRDNGYVAVIVDGAYGYTYLLNTGAFAQITDPGFTGFASRVAMIDGWFIFNQANSRNFYISPQYLGINGNPNQGLQNTKWDPTAVAVADATGDLLVSLIEDQRLVWLPKERATEVWYDAGAQFFTFNRMQGVLLQVGCAAPQSVTRISKGLMWLAANERGQNFVIRTQGFDYDRVSTHAIDFAISSYATVSDAIGWSYIENGHEFYVLTFPTADVTWVYDTGSGLWHERLSFDPVLGQYHRHRGNCVINFQNRRLIGTWDTGALAWMDRSQFQDGNNPIISWRRTGHIWDKQSRRRIFHHQLQIEVAPGAGNLGLPGLPSQTFVTTLSTPVKIFETVVAAPLNPNIWTTNANPVNALAPMIVSNANQITVLTRAGNADSFAHAQGDGHEYLYSNGNGSLLSTPLQPASLASWPFFYTSSQSPPNALWAVGALSNGWAVFAFGNGNFNTANLVSSATTPSMVAVSSFNASTGWGGTTVDIMPALVGSTVVTGDSLFGWLPCADGQHVVIFAATAATPSKWFVISVMGTPPSARLISQGTIPGAVATLLSLSPIGANDRAGGGNTGVGTLRGCLQSDLSTVVLFGTFSTVQRADIFVLPTAGGVMTKFATIANVYPVQGAMPASGGNAIWADKGVAVFMTCSSSPVLSAWNIGTSVSIGGGVQKPAMLLRWSDDGGKTFGNEKQLPIGQIGQFKNRAISYNMGYARDRVYDLRVIDAVNRDLIGATLMSETEQ